MAFQNSVRTELGYGVPGELAFEGPLRARPAVLNSTDPANNVVGRWFTLNADGKTYGAGGTGPMGGLLSNPKVYASSGNSTDGPLGASMTLRNNEIGELIEMGFPVISVAGEVHVGWIAHYNTTTGVIIAVAAGTSPAEGNAAVPNAVFVRVQQTEDGGLACLKLTN